MLLSFVQPKLYPKVWSLSQHSWSKLKIFFWINFIYFIILPLGAIFWLIVFFLWFWFGITVTVWFKSFLILYNYSILIFLPSFLHRFDLIFFLFKANLREVNVLHLFFCCSHESSFKEIIDNILKYNYKKIY